MNLIHLKYFYDSARLGSITKASKLNRIGQPAITKGIQKLESVLNKSLLLHERNRFQLTDHGQTVFSYCVKIFSAVAELTDSVNRTHMPAGKIRFACQASMSESPFLVRSLQAVESAYPKISLKLMLGRTDLVKDWVKNGLIDFGIVIDNVDLTGLEAATIASGFFQMVQHKNFKRDWREVGVLTVEKKREVMEMHRRFSARYGEPLKVKMEIGSWGVIKQFVLEGMAAGYVPDYMIAQELKKKTLSIVDQKILAIPYEVKLVRDPDRYLSQSCQLVISEFKNSRFQK